MKLSKKLVSFRFSWSDILLFFLVQVIFHVFFSNVTTVLYLKNNIYRFEKWPCHAHCERRIF